MMNRPIEIHRQLLNNPHYVYLRIALEGTPNKANGALCIGYDQDTKQYVVVMEKTWNGFTTTSAGDILKYLQACIQAYSTLDMLKIKWHDSEIMEDGKFLDYRREYDVFNHTFHEWSEDVRRKILQGLLGIQMY